MGRNDSSGSKNVKKLIVSNAGENESMTYILMISFQRNLNKLK